MAYQRGHKPSSPHSPGHEKPSPFAPRPFAAPKKAAATAPGPSSPPDPGKPDAVSTGALEEEELLQERFDAGAAEPLGRVVREPGLQTAAPGVQRYTIEREPTSREVYSVSDDKELVTGMTTPNHALFVGNPTKFDRMNSAVAASPLELFPASLDQLFGQKYHRVGLRFKPDFPDKGSSSLQGAYTNAVLPKAESFRRGLLDQKRGEIDKAASESKEIDPGAINEPLATAVKKLDLFKKLILAALAQPGSSDAKSSPIDAAHKIAGVLWRALYSSAMRKIELTAALQEIGIYFNEDDAELPRTPIIRETMAELWDALLRLWEALPVKQAVDLMSFHSARFQAAQLEAIQGPDNVLLYRACDVTASTLLGNKITPENQGRLKTYAARGGAFHYATKIVQSGKDWVTLEGFAAGDLERRITGIDDQSGMKNLDNTWQYIMYGSIGAKEPGALSDEDRQFELYTKLRYYLMDIKEPGTFSLAQRQKLVGRPLTGARFQDLFPAEAAAGIGARIASLFAATPLQKGDALLQSLKAGGILDREGRLVSPERLEMKAVATALPAMYLDKVPKIFGILRDSIPSQHIQMGLSSDLANVEAWLAYLGEDPKGLDTLVDTVLQELGEKRKDPQTLSRDLWSDLPSVLAELKKAGPPPTPALPTPAPPTHPSASVVPPTSDAPKLTAPSISTMLPAWAPRKDVSTRDDLVAEATAEVNRLRIAWRGSDAKRATSDPPGYSDLAAGIKLFLHVHPEIPLEKLARQVTGWLRGASMRWSQS